MNYGRRGVKAKQKALNSKASKLGRKFVLTCVELIIVAIVGVTICAVAAGIGAFKGILANTPQIRLSDVAAPGQATIVYDRLGNEIDQYVGTNSNRIEVPMDQISKYMGLAFVALEDERFFQHNGIDFKGMIRAGYQYVKTGGNEAQGASTITQQLLKNTIFTEWTQEGNNKIKKIKRKIQEQYLALEISKNFSKEDVLERYMNAINLGQNTLGVQAASLRYFGKDCIDLNLSECAVIASITQSPTKYNPILHPDQNKRRRKDCLDKMLELEFITKAEYDAAIADTEDVYLRIGSHDTSFRVTTSTTSTYFSDALYEQVKKDLIADAGYSEAMAEHLMTAGGLRIETTLDPEIQAICDEEFENPKNFPGNTNWYLNYALTIFDANKEKHNYSKEKMMAWFKENKNKKFNLIFSSQDAALEAIETYRAAMFEELGLEEKEDNYEESISMTPQPQAAIVIEDQYTGQVLAMVGGRGPKEGRRTLNRATSAFRSPGSTFKVVAAFAPALDSCGQTLATVYIDGPFNYEDGRPVSNWYGKAYRGVQTIRQAITASLNIVSVKTGTVVTPQVSFDYLLNFGFTSLIDHAVIDGQVYSDIRQPIVLGGLTKGVTPFELNGAYASIANLGLYIEPKLYTRVTNADGDIILDTIRPDARQVIKETTAYLLTDAMMDVVSGSGGTGGRCNFNSKMAIAGKTGTSTDYHDVWFAGFTPYYTCTTWAGYDNSLGMNSSTEGTVAKNLWRAVMSRLHEGLPNATFAMPSGLVEMEVCASSGKLPIPGVCDGHLRTELFAEDNLPIEECPVHFRGDVCVYDGKPAAPECPFKAYGVIQLPLVEDPALDSGATTIVTNTDGTQSVISPTRVYQCMHGVDFFANPNYQEIIDQQAWEISQRPVPEPAAEQPQE